MSKDDYTYLVVKYDNGKVKIHETANGKEITNIKNVELYLDYEEATHPVIRLEIVPKECMLTIK